MEIVVQVEIHGPGIQPEGVARDKPTYFTVDARKAGQKAALEVVIQDALGREVPFKLDEKRDGTVQVHYTPTSSSQHVIMVRILISKELSIFSLQVTYMITQIYTILL